MYKGFKYTVEQDSASASNDQKAKGTVLPCKEFTNNHIVKTIKDLKEAIKKADTDVHPFIDIITNHSNEQRQQLLTTYKRAHAKELLDEMSAMTSGHFRVCLKALFIPSRHYDAVCAWAAMKGAGTNDSLLIAVLCPRTEEELNQLKQGYRELYPKRDLEKDIRGDTSGTYRRILLSAVDGSRASSGDIDSEKAKVDAQRLYDAGEAKLGTDEDIFIEVCAQSSWPHLRQVAREYEKVAGRPLVESVDREFSFNAKKALHTMVEYAMDGERYYTERIYSSLKGREKSVESLIRLIVSRSEKDLAALKQRYLAMYGTTLDSDINRELTGSVKILLLKTLNPKANLRS